MNTTKQGYYKYLLISILKAVGTALLIALGLILGATIFKYALPFIIGYLIFLILRKPHKFLHKKAKFPSKLAAIICVILFYAILIGIFVGIGFLVGQKVTDLIADKDAIIATVTGSISSITARITELTKALPQSVQTSLTDFSGSLSSIVSSVINAAVNIATTTVSGVPGALIFVVMMILSTFIMLYDQEILANFIRNNTPQVIKTAAERFKATTIHALWGYVRAQLMIIGICFGELMIAFTIMKLFNLFEMSWISMIFMCVGIAIVDALPIFGCGAFLIPWALYALIMGRFGLAIALIALYVTCLVVRQFIEPRLVSNNIGLNPLITLLAVYVGFNTMSVLGMFVFPICTILLINMIRLYSKHPTLNDYWHHFSYDHYLEMEKNK
ncbi:MAG: AI-2E family transporter [Clostridia bacterium]|nr:AI-2E family transporter [Clostridia bacterium]